MFGSESHAKTRGRARVARRLSVLTAAALAFAGLAAPSPAAPAARAAAGPSDAYVALGDSYTAGPLIPNQILDWIGCLRSDHNYPHLLAPALGLPQFRDVSCSGAQTRDMTASQNVWPKANPPQLDALDASTRVVTLEIGGNDIGFSGIISGCATASPFGSPCKSKYVVNGVDELRRRIDETGPKVAAVIQGIRARAPQAKIFVLGYPAILPDTGYGCWPTMPIAWLDVAYLRVKHKELNATIAARATANGAYYVDVYSPSVGHDTCKTIGTRWVEPIAPAGLQAAPVHPNLLGMQNMAVIAGTRILQVGF